MQTLLLVEKGGQSILDSDMGGAGSRVLSFHLAKPRVEEIGQAILNTKAK